MNKAPWPVCVWFIFKQIRISKFSRYDNLANAIIIDRICECCKYNFWMPTAVFAISSRQASCNVSVCRWNFWSSPSLCFTSFDLMTVFWHRDYSRIRMNSSISTNFIVVTLADVSAKIGMQASVNVISADLKAFKYLCSGDILQKINQDLYCSKK